MRVALISFSLASIVFASNAAAQSAPAGGAPVASEPAAIPPPPPPPTEPQPILPPASELHLDVSTLKLLREKGILSEAEYDTAIRDMNETTGAEVAGDAPTLVLGKFSTTFYGQVKTDFIYDSTQSFTDLAGNTLVQRPAGAAVAPPPLPFPSNLPSTYETNYAGQNPQFTASDRDSRFGFHIRAPETSGGVRVSGLLEFDFFGLGTTSIPSGDSQNQYFSSAVPRVRHAYFRIDNPIVDVLVGQYWHLFGWQNVYHPASVQAQGLVGELYSRDVQLRLSKTIHTNPLNVDVAVAVLRSPESGSAIPQLEAGLKLAVNHWTGVMTNGSSGTGLQPLSIGVSGNYRDFVLPELSLSPTQNVNLAAESVAVDAFVPIIPATKTRRSNSLSLHGELVYGNGISDLYTGLTGGIAFPYLTNTTPTNPQPVYSPNIDNGMVAFDLQGNLHAVQWTSYLAGLQYYLPFANGRVFLAVNYAHMQSNNTSQFTSDFTNAPPDPLSNHQNSSTWGTRKSIDFGDASLFADVMSGVRVGVEGALYFDHYVDGVQAKNTRVDAAGIFMF
ncbi:MAG: hypothetical protein ACLQVI_16925 [Polyangiaceae bacterium]